MTATVIRLCEAPGHRYAMVVTEWTSVGFRANFQVYLQYPTGKTRVLIDWQFGDERAAIAQWDEWSSNHPWGMDDDKVSNARRLLDDQPPIEHA